MGFCDFLEFGVAHFCQIDPLPPCVTVVDVSNVPVGSLQPAVPVQNCHTTPCATPRTVTYSVPLIYCHTVTLIYCHTVTICNVTHCNISNTYTLIA